MTMENQPCCRCISYQKMVIFQPVRGISSNIRTGSKLGAPNQTHIWLLFSTLPGTKHIPPKREVGNIIDSKVPWEWDMWWYMIVPMKSILNYTSKHQFLWVICFCFMLFFNWYKFPIDQTNPQPKPNRTAGKKPSQETLRALRFDGKQLIHGRKRQKFLGLGAQGEPLLGGAPSGLPLSRLRKILVTFRGVGG